MNNILILSNNSVSKSESNGRIHSNLILNYIPNHLFNFYVRGIPDVDGVDYITCLPREALLSKLTFNIKKIKFSKPDIGKTNNINNGPNSKSKYVIFHILRSFAYLNNKSILCKLRKYVVENKITIIMLWGCNVPFLYRYAWKLARLCNIRLVIFTGEDYPLKNYNYINREKILYKFLKHQLYRECKKAYEVSSNNFYCNEELKKIYSSEFSTKNDEVVYFPSNFNKVQKNIDRPIKRILYGGNLYNGRVDSLCDIANLLKDRNDVVINVYGKASDEAINKLKCYPNIKFYGEVQYYQLVEFIKQTDLLLHVEGFSKEYIKDCKFAFSTKISDYFNSGLPIFIYGPKEISGISFAYKLYEKVVATGKNELYKLLDLIDRKTIFDLDYTIVENFFSIKNNKIFSILENKN